MKVGSRWALLHKNTGWRASSGWKDNGKFREKQYETMKNSLLRSISNSRYSHATRGFALSDSETVGEGKEKSETQITDVSGNYPNITTVTYHKSFAERSSILDTTCKCRDKARDGHSHVWISSLILAPIYSNLRRMIRLKNATLTFQRSTSLDNVF